MTLFQIAMVGNIWKNDLNLEIFWHFLCPNLNKWGKNDLKFSESLLLNKFETKYYETFAAILQKTFFIVLPVLIQVYALKMTS